MLQLLEKLLRYLPEYQSLTARLEALKQGYTADDADGAGRLLDDLERPFHNPGEELGLSAQGALNNLSVINNQAPNAQDDSYAFTASLAQSMISVAPIQGVILNTAGADTDPDAWPQILLVSSFDTTSEMGTTVVMLEDGSFQYDASQMDMAYLAAYDENNPMLGSNYMLDGFSYAVSDGLLADTADVQVMIMGVNDTPFLVSGSMPAVSVFEDQALQLDMGAQFADIDVGDSLSYTATLLSGAALPSWLSFDTATGEFSGTPLNTDVGTISISMTATDLANASVNSTFDLEVLNSNDTPHLVNGFLPNSWITEDQALQLDMGAQFADIDVGDSLSYMATLLSGAALPSWLNFDTATGEFTGTPLNADVGMISISMTATDLAGASVNSAFDLEVINANDAPIVQDFSLQGSEDNPVNFSFNDFQAYLQDTDNNIADLQINILSISAGSIDTAWQDIFAANSSVNFTAALHNSSDVTISFEAVDPSGGTSSPATITIQLDPVADAPSIQTSQMQLNSGNQSFTFDLSAQLIDTDASESLVVSVSESIPGAVVTPSQFTTNAEGTAVNQSVSIDYSAVTAMTTLTFTATSTETQNNDQASDSTNIIIGTESPIDLDEFLFDFSTGPSTTGLMNSQDLTFSTVGAMPREVDTIHVSGNFDGVAGDETLFSFIRAPERVGLLSSDDLTFITLGNLPTEIGSIELAGNFDGVAGDEVLFSFSNNSSRVGILDVQSLNFLTLGDLPTEVGTLELAGNFDGLAGDEVLFSFSNDASRIGMLNLGDMTFTTLGDLPPEVGTLISAGNFDGVDGEDVLFSFSNNADRIGLLSLDDFSFTTIGDLPGEVDEILSIGNFNVSSQTGDDILLSTSMDDILLGLTGADTFTFDLSQATGADYVPDFMRADDTLKFVNVQEQSGFGVVDDGQDVTINWDDTTGAGDAGSVILADLGGANMATMQDLIDAGITVVVEAQ